MCVVLKRLGVIYILHRYMHKMLDYITGGPHFCDVKFTVNSVSVQLHDLLTDRFIITFD